MSTKNNFKPLFLNWDIDEYTLQVKNTDPETKKTVKTVDKTVVSKVKGEFQAGDFVAIMGPSGAGKTTVLNLLSDQVGARKGSVLKREVKLNGNPLTARNFGKQAAYVMQDDRLFATLTCKESIEFAVNMKLNISPEEKEEKVNSILAELGLLKCADTIVGNSKMKGVSGGERKRISIAVELVTDPDIIFLDEPTSGLDTITAFRICKQLKKLSDRGKIVVCTIHQPTAEAFFLFNKLILLAKGRLMYQGPTTESVPFFKDAGFPCPEFLNPIEYFMKIIQPRGDPEEAAQQYRRLVSYYETHGKTRVANSSSGQVTVKMASIEGSHLTHEADLKPVSSSTKLYYLTKRALHNVIRDKGMIATRVATCLVFAFLGLILWADSDNSYTGTEDKIGFLHFAGMSQFAANVQGVVLSFPAEKEVFLKENSGRMYSTTSYFIAKNLPEFPYEQIFPLIFCAIMYHGVGLYDEDGGSHFFWFIFIVILTAINGTSFGFIISSSFDDLEAIATIGILSLLPFFMTAGVIVNVSEIGWWFSWMQVFSPLRFSLEALARNEFDDRAREDLCPELGGCDPVDKYSLDFGFTECVLALALMCIIYRVIALFIMIYRAKKVG